MALRRGGFGAAAKYSRAVHESAVCGITERPWRRRKRELGSLPGAWYAPVSAGARGRGIGASIAKGQPVSDKPNVLIIWGDDIGQSNLSCYSSGLMGIPNPYHRSAARP